MVNMNLLGAKMNISKIQCIHSNEDADLLYRQQYTLQCMKKPLLLVKNGFSSFTSTSRKRNTLFGI